MIWQQLSKIVFARSLKNSTKFKNIKNAKQSWILSYNL